jgi:hypothetical protein
MRLTAFAISFLLCLSPAMAGGMDEQRSGKGWVEFRPIPAGPDYAFLRNFAQTQEDYELSKKIGPEPWGVDELKVGYWDLNDDGVEEMFLSYAEISVYHCGGFGCSTYSFQKQGDRWLEIAQFNSFGFFVSDEKVNGYRTLYNHEGARARWSGATYFWDCPEDAPADVRDDLTSTCFREDRWLREKNEPRESWPPAK